MILPDVSEMYPQKEPELFGGCAQCGSDINVGEDYVEVDSYAFCDEICFGKFAVEEGIAFKRIAERG